MISSEALLSNESTQPEEKKPEPTKADQLPITTVDNSASISEEDQQLENSKTTLLEEQNENLNKLLNSVNYGIILAFFDKFAVHLSLKEIAIFKNFETSLINKKTLNKKLLDFHINLLKNLHVGKNVKKDKWEHYLVKYVSKFSVEESLQIEQNGYLSCDIDLRLTIAKNLLESQFDENLKFKQILIEQITDLNSLRSVPIGRDKDGLVYWLFLDKEYSIRIFTQNGNDAKTWKLIVKDLLELKELIEKLNSEPSLTKLRSSKRYLANIEKEKKRKEQQLKEQEDNLKNEKKEILLDNLNKDDDLVEDAQQILDVEEKSTPSSDQIKKDEDSSQLFKTESSSSDSSPSTNSEENEETKDELKEEIKEEEVKEEEFKEEEESNSNSEKSLKNELKTQESKKQEIVEEKIEQEETEDSKEEIIKEEKEKSPEKVTKLEDTLKIPDDDFLQPIALRKSTRASARKAQEIQQLQILKTPTKSPKKVSQPQSTKKKSELAKIAQDELIDKEDDMDDEEEEENTVRISKRKKNSKDENDVEFKPKLSKTPTKEASSTKKSKNRKKKPETESEQEEEDNEDEDSNFDSSCIKCSKVKKNQLLLLCDGCDAAYHLVCLKMDEVPDGDWFCQICEHDKLIRALQDKSAQIDNHFKEIELAKTKSISKRTNRIADIGANLDSLFKSGNRKRARNNKDDENNDPNDDEDDDNDNENTISRKKQRRQPFEDVNHKSRGNYFSNTEPLGPRSCRAKTRISYTFEEYDRTIKEAVGEKTTLDDEYEDGSESKNNKSKRETRRTSQIKKVKEYEDDDTEFEDEEEDDIHSNDDQSNANSSSSEFKVTAKKKVYSESEEELDDDEEKKFSDDDEDFRPSRRSKTKSESNRKKRNTKKSKKSKKIRSKRTKEKYEEDDITDEDDENEDQDEDDPSDEDYSDDEDSFRKSAKKSKHLYDSYYERRSTRNRKCLKESYCELDEDEEYQEKKKSKSKKSKMFDTDESDNFSENLSEEDNWKKKSSLRRTSNRVKKTSRKYNEDYDVDDQEDEDYKSYYENDDDDEKSLTMDHRNNTIAETKKVKSRIKKPWSDDDEEDDQAEKSEKSDQSDQEITNKKPKNVIKKPWSDEDDDNNGVDEKVEDQEKEKEKIEEEKKLAVEISKDPIEVTEETKKEEKKSDDLIAKSEQTQVKLLSNTEANQSQSNGHKKSNLVYSSSSSYSSSQSSSRTASPAPQSTNIKMDEKVNSESLIDKLNKASSLNNDDLKLKLNKTENSVNLNKDILVKKSDEANSERSNATLMIQVKSQSVNEINQKPLDIQPHSDMQKKSDAKKKNTKKSEKSTQAQQSETNVNKLSTNISMSISSSPVIKTIEKTVKTSSTNLSMQPTQPLPVSTIVYSSPTVSSSNQFISMQNKPAQQIVPQNQVPFQFYNTTDMKPQFINSHPLTLNNYPNINAINTNPNNSSSFPASSSYSPGYPQLYYYYQQQQQQHQQQQFNPQTFQPLMIQQANNISQPIQAPTMLTSNMTNQTLQPVSFLQPYTSNTMTFNGQAATSGMNNFFNPGYSIQPSGNLFQPHLINFNASVTNNSVTNGIATNGIPVTMTTQPAHQPQIKQ